jgi:membrane fusion protein (multidrug efflux system)
LTRGRQLCYFSPSHTNFNKVMARMRSWWIRLLAGALVLGLASTASPRPGKPPPRPSVRPVEVWVVKRIDLPTTISVQGRAAAWREAKLACEVAGVIKKFNYDRGQRVPENKVIVQLEPDNYRRRLAEARANLAKAQATETHARLNFNRLDKLLRQRVTARSQLDESRAAFLRAKADVRLAQVAVEQAQYNLDKTGIIAPFDGIVLRRYREPGEMITAGTILIHLADYRTIKLEVGLTEDQVVQVRRGQKATVTFSVFKDRTFPGRVDVIGVSADEDTGIFPIRIVVPNPELTIYPGMIARARLAGRTIKNIILVPAEAVIEQFGLSFVYVVNSDHALKRQVKLGPAFGEKRQIASGLKAGDRLVVVGQSQLRPNLKVKIVRVHP